MLHARTGKGSGKQLPAHPFFLRGPKPCLLPFPCRNMYGKAACLPLSCPMLTVYLIHAVFSPADVVESLTMHVEFKLFLSLPVLFQGIRQGVHSLRHNFLLPFFHAAHAA